MPLSIRSTHAELKLPLALYESITLGTAESTDGTQFSIVAGMNEGLVRQLRTRSLDTTDIELQKTSDYERFGQGSYEEWYASKERTLFALVETESGTLAAVAWFGPKPLGRKSMKHLSTEERAEDERLMDSGNWHTIVYRSYAPFRGIGLMTSFVTFAMSEYARAYPDVKLWAGIYAENPASISFAKKLGFHILEEASAPDAQETIMVKE